jgi:hypothetical protein
MTPWGIGSWGSTRGSGSEAAPADAVFADFGGGQHSLSVLHRPCLRLASIRKVAPLVVR